MFFSKLFCPTIKENPSEAEVISHKLMLRSGMIRQVASGIYSLLPTGLKTMRKVEQIIRQEMNVAGAQEVSLPAVHPAQLWRESGRWDSIGKELLRFKDRNGRDYCFGPTHEEVITDLIRRGVRSYRDLPRTLYQIQVKFRDEVRPRFGLMRCREFMMKDAYSFDVDDSACEESYEKMYQAYCKIFSRCDLDYRAVDADSGNIGGSRSQEFMVLAKSGEDEIVSCTSCDYSANMEKATIKIKVENGKKGNQERLELKSTPGKKSIEEIAGFLKIPASDLLKTLIYKTERAFIAVLIPGNRDVNETKLTRHLGATHLNLASPSEVQKLSGASPGFLGPINLEIGPQHIERVIIDVHVTNGDSYVTGANLEDTHYMGVVAGKDFLLTDQADIHKASAGDSCSKCGQALRVDRGIEVGHIFKLGTKYSEVMEATFTDSTGKQKLTVMGCYGIGIGRTVAAAIEQNHDEGGIIFPCALCPFEVAIVPIEWENEVLKKEAIQVYENLSKVGYEPLLDDRLETPGSKFKDSDLLGIPIRITIGEKGISRGKIEVKLRWANKGEFIEKQNLLGWVESALQIKKARRNT